MKLKKKQLYCKVEPRRSGGMVYTHDSKSCLARDGGSSPLSGTYILTKELHSLQFARKLSFTKGCIMSDSVQNPNPNTGWWQRRRAQKLARRLKKIRRDFYYFVGHAVSAEKDEVEAALEFHHKQCDLYEDWRKPILDEIAEVIRLKIRLKFKLGNFNMVDEWLESFSGPSMYYIETGPFEISQQVARLAIEKIQTFSDAVMICGLGVGFLLQETKKDLIEWMIHRARSQEEWATIMRLSDDFSGDPIFRDVIRRAAAWFEAEKAALGQTSTPSSAQC